MPVTATHEELADVMLTAIAGMQRRCDEEAPGWAALLDPLAECRADWQAYRAEPERPRPAVLRRLCRVRDSSRRKLAKAVGDTLAKVHKQLVRVAAARSRWDAVKDLRDLRGLGAPKLTPQEASYRSREAVYAAACEAAPAWHDQRGRCACAAHESCGRGCPNYLVGSQAACASPPHKAYAA